MSAVRTLLIGILGTLCILPGCAKKPKLPAPSATAASATDQAATVDSGDIFNEFFDDSSVDKAKNMKTFSPHQANAGTPAKASPAPSSGTYAPSFSDDGRYVVQVATMASRWLADELATELREKGYPAYTTEVQNPTQNLAGTYYRVRIGGFVSRTDARAFGENILVPARFSYWVDRKSNESSAPLEPQFNQNAPSYGTSSSSQAASPTKTPSSSTQASPSNPGYGSSGQTPSSSSTGGWRDSSSKW